MQVFIKLDDKKTIVDINSEQFIDNTSDYVLIDDGMGDKYAHAQTQYLDKPLYDDNGLPNYKYYYKKIVELNDEEKQAYKQEDDGTQDDLEVNTQMAQTITELANQVAFLMQQYGGEK